MALDKIKRQLEQKAETISDKAKEYSEMAVSSAKDGVKAVSEIAQDGRFKLRMNYYSPVFPEEYRNPDFDLPKMIVIADEDERKGVDVCVGSIGWLSKEGDLEVFHLYEEAVSMCGLHFHPRPVCDSIYYLDAFDNRRFVNLDCYFEVMQQDKMTELRGIAYSLGAKRCRLETYEAAKEISIKKSRRGAKVSTIAPKGRLKGESSLEAEHLSSKSSETSTLFEHTFEGDATPKCPELQWYAHDKEINFLINTRCSGSDYNSTKDYRIEIDCSASSTLSIRMASKIDAALNKLGASCNFSFEGEVMNESRRKLMFEVEF